ncbi:glycosyltransferase [Deinococcus aquaticus]|uniref:glycosyltransferase n=1 Tax=Deinococcus aquaticus TaxID=328692 RepID=UPI003611DDA4
MSILIPARDEAHNLPRTLPGVLAQGAFEVLVLDDGSGDGTADVARRLGARVLTGEPRPDGWNGKPWACQQLLRAARSEVLIFTDADVDWHAGALGGLLSELTRSGADLLSIQPRQSNAGLGARLLTPLVDAAVLSYFPFPLTRLRHPMTSIANGQVMAFRRAALRSVGGYAPVRAEVLEDTRLAQHLGAQGFLVSTALGRACIGVRMYRTYPESVAGFSKNVLPLHFHSRPLLLLAAAGHLGAYTLPWLLRPGYAAPAGRPCAWPGCWNARWSAWLPVAAPPPTGRGPARPPHAAAGPARVPPRPAPHRHLEGPRVPAVTETPHTHQ